MNLQTELSELRKELKELKALIRKDYGEMLDAKAAAHYLGISINALHKKSCPSNMQIPYTRKGGKKMYSKKSLVNWLKKNDKT
jgi:hypothetical protein